MSVHYSPGAHPVAVTPHGFAVLAGDTSPALAARIHALLADGRGLGGVLEALTGAYGTSLSAVPPFAVVLAERDAVRLAVRGSFALEVTAGTSERISGEGVTTWTERVIADVSRVELVGVPDAAPAELPVGDGVVLADALAWAPSGASAVAPVAPAAPAAPAKPRPAASAAPAAEPAPAEPAEPEPEPEPDAQPEAEPEAVPEPEVAPEVDPEPEAEPSDATPTPARGVAASAPPARVAVVPPAVVPAPAAAPVATPGLIDSAAVLSVADTLLPAESTLIPSHEREAGPGASEDAAGLLDAEDGVDATVARPTPAAVPLGDHDGETVSVAEARAMRTGDSAPPPLAPPRPPAPGRVRVSTGQVLLLDRTVVIGRRPRSTRVSGTDLPHLVAVDSPLQDISRSHVELRVEGDSILATDLNTTNGTTLLRPGVDPVRLHPGEGTVVVPGDVIDLGDGITVAIEELS
ncbi:FHA domain-containing protein [Microbacterium sp. SSM24]|uniref:FHA domain-containing protein n=1 Tax=Microbacterium sp. SSM24 TaxID=2991714 RepID=UPI0022265D53|nr:FHA domain-containing protein [Microbacterium sp. SSM24]MCW3492801.1 FHA domain-containing protein [Microbacterium sp. SSM24]